MIMDEPILQPFIFDPQESWEAIQKIVSVFQDLGVFKSEQPALSDRAHDMGPYTRLFGGYDPSNNKLSANYIYMSKTVDGIGEQFIDYFEHSKGVSLDDIVMTRSLEMTYGLICLMCDRRMDSDIFFSLLEDRVYRWANGALRKPTEKQTELHKTAADSDTDMKFEDLSAEDNPLRPAMPQEVTGKLIREGKLNIRSQKYVFSENKIISIT